MPPVAGPGAAPPPSVPATIGDDPAVGASVARRAEEQGPRGRDRAQTVAPAPALEATPDALPGDSGPRATVPARPERDTGSVGPPPAADGTAAASDRTAASPLAIPSDPAALDTGKPSPGRAGEGTVNPLAGRTFYGPNAGAAAAAEQPGRSPEDVALLADLAGVPTATWLGAWSGDVTATVSRVIADARQAGGIPIFVIYNIPARDCGGHSAGGAGSAAGYGDWVERVAAGIGTADAVVVVEPDALAQLCGEPDRRFGMLRAAVEELERNPGTYTYLDAGHSDWIDAATMAQRLRGAGAAAADGFALNVSNFGTTASNVAYGRQLSALLGDAHFVVDTSRNGNGPGNDWCNPAGRALGDRPTTTTDQPSVDAFLWIKTPGESDGTCNGGPSAGVFWPSYALELIRAG